MRRVVLMATALMWIVLVATSGGSGAWAQGGPTPISYGQNFTGELASPQIEALYRFSAQQGDVITITMDSLEGNIDPFVILLDGTQQNVLAVDNDGGGNRNSRLRFVVPSSGVYVIRATTAQGPGEGNIRGKFQISLTLGNPTPTPSPNIGTPQIAPIKLGDLVQADLNDAVRFRLYSLQARQGETISFSVETTNALSVGMYLYSADLSQQVGSAELGQKLTAAAPVDGTYFLMVARAARTGAGSFTLRPLPGPSVLSIKLGQTVRGSVSDATYSRTYSLQGKAGQPIIARMRRLTGNLAAYVYLVAVDSGQKLAEASGPKGTAELRATLPSDGTYAVVASREGQQAGTSSGAYTLAVLPPTDALTVPEPFKNFAALNYGDKVSGILDDSKYVVPYLFAAEVGDVIQATMTGSGGLDSFLTLQSADGNAIAQDDNGGGSKDARLQTRIPQAGYYALMAGRAGLARGTTSGGFTLSLSAVDSSQVGSDSPLPGSILLVAGQTHQGKIGPNIAEVLRFEVRANTTTSLDVSAEAGMDLTVILADDSLRQVAAGTIRDVLLSKAGTYIVFVVRRGGPNDPSIGPYRITLQGTLNAPPTATPAALGPGQSVTGTINNIIYQVRYAVDAQAGDNLLVTMDAPPGSALDPMVVLLEPEGKLLAVNDNRAAGTKDAALIFDVPRDGRYTILATRSGEAAGTSIGPYVFKVEVRRAGIRPLQTAQATATNTLAVPGQPTRLGSPSPQAQTPSPTAGNSALSVIPIAYGSVVEGTISASRSMVYYTFQGSAGDVVNILMSTPPGSTLDPLVYLYVYADQPILIATNDNVAQGNTDAAITRFELPRTGPYVIIATRSSVGQQGRSAGAYFLTLAHAPALGS